MDSNEGNGRYLESTDKYGEANDKYKVGNDKYGDGNDESKERNDKYGESNNKYGEWNDKYGEGNDKYVEGNDKYNERNDKYVDGNDKYVESPPSYGQPMCLSKDMPCDGKIPCCPPKLFCKRSDGLGELDNGVDYPIPTCWSSLEGLLLMVKAFDWKFCYSSAGNNLSGLKK